MKKEKIYFQIARSPKQLGKNQEITQTTRKNQELTQTTRKELGIHTNNSKEPGTHTNNSEESGTHTNNSEEPGTHTNNSERTRSSHKQLGKNQELTPNALEHKAGYGRTMNEWFDVHRKH